MIKKMYSNYEINKKYAIRKLSIGAFSIAIGLFASNMNELPVIGTHLGPSIVHAAEPEVTNWKPDGNIIAQGEDGVPWELYENGYLLFKPEPGKDTLTNGTFPHYITSWKNYSDKIKAIGFTKEVFLPEDSSFFFKGSENLELPEGYWEEEDYKKNLSNLEFIETSKINTSKTKNMRGLFYRVEKIKQLNLNNWDVSNVNDMSKMFWSSNFNYLDLNDWNTINVKNMYEMFRETRDLETLKVSNWNTSNVTNMTAMFFIYPNKEQGNSKLKELDVSKWDVSNVEDFRYMFEGQDKLEKLNVSNWNPIKAKSMYYMFHSASSLKNLDVSKWDVSNAEQLGGLFVNNYSLQYLDLTNWDITNLPNVDTASYNKFAIIGAIFQNLKSLNKLKMGINFKPTGSENIFEGLRFHLQPEKYTERWVKEDGSAGPYTVNEWWEAYKANPEMLAGTWVREKKPVLTVNFNTGSNETINPLSVNGNSTDELPVPTEDKPGYKFLGWSKTEDGDIIKNKSEIGQPGETVTLYAKWEKVDNVRKENTPIEMTTVYEGDEELETGTNKEINGVPGEKEIITTYEVTPITGELINPSITENIITPMTPKTIKIGTKPKVVYSKQGDNVVKTTTRYTVNSNNGDVTEDVTEEIVGRGTVADKIVEKRLHYGVEYERNDEVSAGTPNVIRQTGVDGKKTIRTSYNVDPETGNITANEPVETIENPTPQIEVVGTKSEEIVTEQEFKKTYIGDETKEKGLTEISLPGVNGKTVITRTYNLPENVPVREEQDEINEVRIVFNYEFNTAIPNDSQPSITQPTNEIVKVGTRPKVVYSKDGDDIVKSTTIYIVDPNNGTISENTTKETFNKDGVKTKVEVTPIPSPNKYVKDDTREKGADNIIEQGTPGSKTVTTTYDVNPEDGSKIENVGNPIIVNPTDTIIKVAAKNKVEIVKEKGQTIERTTNYTVNEKTGEISETVTDKLISSNTPLIPNINGSDLPDEPELNTNEKPEYKESVSTNTTTDEKGNEILPPVVEELPEYNGGANPTDSPVNEKPEYTGELSTNTPIDENENLIFPPVVDELPEFTGSVNPSDAPIHEIPEYTNSLSINTPVDENGNLILPPVLDRPEFNGNVNSAEPPIVEKHKYTEPISTNTPPIDDNGNQILPPVENKLEYTSDLTEKPKEEPVKETTKEETKVENKKEKELPNTNSTSILTTLISSVIGTLGLGYKSKRRK